MQNRNVLEQIRQEVKGHEGQRVLVSARRARRGFAVNRGVLEATYPSIFTITTDDDQDSRLSFSYSEILTRNVILEWE
ncbi:MAG: Veg family protein [Bacillota bacterium]